MTAHAPGGGTAAARGLREEIRQTRPFSSKTQEAFLGLLRTADMAKRRFSTLFEPEDLTFQQYNVLRILRGAGPQGLPTLEIGDRMIERTPGVTRIVDRLESKGWVERERCTEDRRKVWCRLTAAGRELLGRLDEPVAQADRDLFAEVGDDELQGFIQFMDELRRLIDERLDETS